MMILKTGNEKAASSIVQFLLTQTEVKLWKHLPCYQPITRVITVIIEMVQPTIYYFITVWALLSQFRRDRQKNVFKLYAYSSLKHLYWLKSLVSSTSESLCVSKVTFDKFLFELFSFSYFLVVALSQARKWIIICTHKSMQPSSSKSDPEKALPRRARVDTLRL